MGDERQVSVLLRTHEKAVREVLREARRAVEDAKDAELAAAARDAPLDEIHVLRFVMSAAKRAKPVEATVRAVVANIEYRAKHRDELARARRGLHPTEDDKHDDSFVDWETCPPLHPTGWMGDDLLVFGCIGAVDMREVGKRFTPDAITQNTCLLHERFRARLDARTRATGRLSKLVSVFDMAGFSVSKLDTSVLRAFGNTSKHNDTHLPQYLSTVVILNPPMMFRVVYNIAVPFVSSATMDKIKLCKHKFSSSSSSSNANSNSATACPFLAKHQGSVNAVPKAYGGSCEKDVQ